MFSVTLSAQTADINHLRTAFMQEKDDSAKLEIYAGLKSHYVERNFDSFFYYAHQLLQFADGKKIRRTKVIAMNDIGYAFTTAGNLTEAMEFILQAKKLAEEIKDTFHLGSSYHLLGNLFNGKRDYRAAIDHYKKAAAIGEKDRDTSHYPYTSAMNIAAVYRQMKKTDSALYYAQRAYEMALRYNKAYFPHVLRILGKVHQDMGNNELSFYYFRTSLQQAVLQNAPPRTIGSIYLALSDVFEKTGNNDSAFYYAKACYDILKGTAYQPAIMQANLRLSELFTNSDSAYKYLKVSMALKDSVDKSGEAMRFEALRYQEEMREQKLKQDAILAEQNRRQNLQYAGVGGSIVLFLILFLILSHSIIVNEKVVRFLGVVALLIVFEFINLLLHPTLGALTHHSPAWMLIIMVAIAALLVPLHHKLEHWITSSMVEKNKRIRLKAAKKTIAELERSN
jgi:tetratricopeptide (TPR) repeat protein